MNADTTKFLKAFAGRHTFQTFSDQPPDGPDPYAIIHQSTRELSTLNRKGAGVYLMINEGDGRGRTNDHVIRVRAHFADFDGQPLPDTWPLEPSLTVESSPGKYHAYWLLDPPSAPDNTLFNAIQESIARTVGARPDDAKGLARVMRVPGYQHHKRDPYLTRLLTYHPKRTYTLEAIRAAYGPTTDPTPPERPTYAAPSGNPQPHDRPTPEKILEVMLERADLNDGRNTIGFNIACQIRDNGYPQVEAERVMSEYQRLMEHGEHPYTLHEALDSVRQAYTQPARAPWAAPTRNAGSITVTAPQDAPNDPLAAPSVQTPGIYQHDGGYHIDRPIKKGGEIIDWVPDKLTNWTFTPTLKLVTPDGRHAERGALTINHTHTHAVDIPSTAWSTRKDLLDVLSPYEAVCFTTNNKDIANIRQTIILNHHALPTAYGTDSLGLHYTHNQWIELYENTSLHTLEHDPLYYSGTPVDPGSPAFTAPRPATPEQIQHAKRVIIALTHMITPAAALALLGYATAGVFAPRITPHLGNRLPFLYQTGEKESGKTSAVQLILELTTGHPSARLHKANGMSDYQYDLSYSNHNNQPAALDEYRPGEINDGQLRKHHDLGTKWRGTGLAGKELHWNLNTPLIVLGEGFTDDAAALSRGVLYFINKQDRGDQHTYAQALKIPAWPYAHHLHALARTTPESDHITRLHTAQATATTATNNKGGPRLHYALTFIAYGLLLLQADVSTATFSDANIMHCLTTGVTTTLNDANEGSTNIETFLEQLGHLASQTKDPHAYMIPAATPGSLILRISPCVELVKKNYRHRAAISNPRMLRQYAEGAPYINTAPKHRDVLQSNTRGVLVALREVPERCDTSALEYLEEKLRSET